MPRTMDRTPRDKTYLVCIFNSFLSQSELDSLAKLVAEQKQLDTNSLWGFASLFPQELSKLSLMSIDGVDKLIQISSAIILREVSPGWEGRLSCCNSAVSSSCVETGTSASGCSVLGPIARRVFTVAVSLLSITLRNV